MLIDRAACDAFWRDYLARLPDVCRRLGGTFDGRTPVTCQVFRVIWSRDRVQ